jgi:HK97 family phage portal protein/HK97 family phage prohead protease
MNRWKTAALALLGKGSRLLSLRDPDGWGSRGADSASGASVNAESVMALSAVWGCINLIAGTIASLPLMMYRTAEDGSRKIAKDHPLYRVLHDSPNSQQTALDFWEFICASIELWGNGYARKLTIGGRVVGLKPIMPDAITVRRLANGDLQYRWTEDGVSFVENSAAVLHVRGFGGNPLGGLSTLAFGKRVFGLAIAIDQAAGSTFRNGLRPSGVLSFTDWIPKERRDDVDKAMVEKYMGAMNAGRPLILEGGATWSSLGISPEDAQMLESRGFSIEEICRFFGVPPFMIGHTNESSNWGTGLEQQTLGFQKFTLRRRLKRIEQAIEKQLLAPADLAAGITVEFNLEGLLRGDSTGRANFYTSALGDTQKPGWMLRNEVRRLENLSPVDGWDEPVPLIRQITAANKDDVMTTSALRTKSGETGFATKDFALQIKALSEDGTFEGYGSIFGNVDSYGEIVEPGAFAKSLAQYERTKTAPLMLWQHNPDKPIGVWDGLQEDGKGLKGTGRLVLETAQGREAYALLKAGAVRGLSIGYVEVKAEPDGNNRRLKELDLREISIVSFPANRRAQVGAVKSERMEEFVRRLRDGDPMPIKDFEDILREAGVPKAMAVQIASVGYAKAIRSESEGDQATAFLRALRNV